jgi:hypothetical protein
MSAVLRVDGLHVDVDACTAWMPPSVKIERIWRTGEVGRRGAISETSGFSALLSEAEGHQLVEEARVAFAEIADRVGDLVKAGARAELDFAVFVGQEEARSLVAEPEFLSELGKHRVRLLVSAYPTAEGEE